MTTHEITVKSAAPFWRAICSCDAYRSMSYTNKALAVRDGEAHVRGKRRAAA